MKEELPPLLGTPFVKPRVLPPFGDVVHFHVDLSHSLPLFSEPNFSGDKVPVPFSFLPVVVFAALLLGPVAPPFLGLMTFFPKRIFPGRANHSLDEASVSLP